MIKYDDENQNALTTILDEQAAKKTRQDMKYPEHEMDRLYNEKHGYRGRYPTVKDWENNKAKAEREAEARALYNQER